MISELKPFDDDTRLHDMKSDFEVVEPMNASTSGTGERIRNRSLSLRRLQ